MSQPGNRNPNLPHAKQKLLPLKLGSTWFSRNIKIKKFQNKNLHAPAQIRSWFPGFVVLHPNLYPMLLQEVAGRIRL